MSRIKRKNTKPEVMLRKALWNLGLRYRIDCKSLPGRPDLINKKLKFAIFIDGEFWHGYRWEAKIKSIKTNRAFWIPKIERNMQRDAEVNNALEQKGYRVFRFWEREVKQELGNCVKQVLDYIYYLEHQY
ncbi:very short patch repair endonuclease [soil metagenome]